MKEYGHVYQALQRPEHEITVLKSRLATKTLIDNLTDAQAEEVITKFLRDLKAQGYPCASMLDLANLSIPSDQIERIMTKLERAGKVAEVIDA